MSMILKTILSSVLFVHLSVHAWSAADDERNRQRSMASMRVNTAQFELNQARMMQNMQKSWAQNSAAARQDMSGGYQRSYSSSMPAYNAVGQLSQTLGSIRDRMNKPAPTLRIQAKAETDADVLQRFTDAAHGGNHVSAVWVGKMYYSGYGTARDDAKAAQWFKRAAELGNPDGAYHYGYMRMYGHGVAADPSDAVSWYKRAAEAGSARGELSYASALIAGNGIARNEALAVPMMKSLVARNMQLSSDPDIREAQALMAGLLGDFYRSGTGVDKDINEAVRWYSLAAERGDRFAARDLAKMYYQGDGVGKDIKQFLAWTAKAAELGHPEAQANLGLMLVQGKDLPKDVSTGVKLVQDAAQQGDGFAWSLVGGFHQDGLLPKSPAQAARAYQQAVAKGYPDARFDLTPALLRTAQIEPDAGAVAKDQQDAQAGQAQAMLRLADRYADGIGVAENLAQALLWYGKAADRGNAVAQGMYGLLLITGQAGVKDVKKGITQTERAAAAGDAGAMFNMGELYANGFFGSDNAKTQATEWFQKAWKAGHARAEQVLASLTAH